MTRPIDSIARIPLAFFGLAMLFVSTADVLSPRVRYRQSSPEPADMLAAPPAEVTVHFRGELSPQSTIRVVSTVAILPSGERSYSGGEDVVATSGFDPKDASRSCLRAVLRPGLRSGLFRVDWTTLAARGKAERHGSYYFGVGMMMFLLIIGLSLVYVSSVVPDDVRAAILRGLALVFFAALPGWLYLQFMWSERTTIWSEYVGNLYRLHIDEYACLPEPPRARRPWSTRPHQRNCRGPHPSRPPPRSDRTRKTRARTASETREA